jgi:CRISPR-associated endonuclease Csn1
MVTYLGLDLGTSSLGWALIQYDDDHKGIIASGVRIFPEALTGKSEAAKEPKNAERRRKRLSRRQQRRRRYRKHAIKEILYGASMMPKIHKDVYENEKTSPYQLREKAVNSKIELHDLGRVFFHLSRRIGFGGSPKRSLEQFVTEQEKKQDKEEKEIKEKANQLSELIGEKTLGAYLATQNIQRGYHLNRKMVKDEFDCIWHEQKKHYPQILTDTFKQNLENTIFFRNPIFWRWKTLGKCDLEPESRLLMKSEWLAQEFIMLQDLNNLKLATGNNRPLDTTERSILHKLFRRNVKVTFKQMRTALKEYWADNGTEPNTKFNFETGADQRKELSGNAVDAMLCKSFGDDVFQRDDLDDMRAKIPSLKWEIENQILHEGFHPVFKGKRVEIKNKQQIDEAESQFVRGAKECWNATDDEAKALLNFNLPSGWMRYSEKAISNLLPEMNDGKKMTDVLDNLYPREDRLLGEDRDILPSHHSFMPDLRNPVVTRCLNETRKVVNNIIRTYGKPDYIRIEMARDIKLAGKKKANALEINKKRKNQRNAGKKFLTNNNIPVNEWSLLKYILWQESGERDIYSGDAIGCDDLFRRGRFQIEHIMPRSRSLDDSLNNLLLCREDLNKIKSDRTPFEAFGGDKDKWEGMLARLDEFKIRPEKKKRFIRTEYKSDDEYRNQQLVDTAYAAHAVRDFLATLYPKGEAIDWAKGRPPRVQVTNGQITSQLGKAWKLYKHFNTWFCDEEKNIKNRDDHRHHALDGIIVAMTTPGLINKLASEYNEKRREGGSYEDIISNKLNFRPPWPSFHEEVKNSLDKIIVSYRVDSKTNGALTDEQQLGCRINSDGEREYVRRIKLQELTPSKFLKIRDKKVQSIIWKKIIEIWNENQDNDTILSDDFMQELKPKSGQKNKKLEDDTFEKTFSDDSNFPYMPSKNGDGNIIKSVRITVGDKNFPTANAKTPKSAYAMGDNHHVALYQNDDGEILFKAVSKLEVRRRIDKRQPIIEQHFEGIPLLCALHKRDMLRKTDLKSGNETYYRIEVLRSKKQMVIFPHNNATAKGKKQPSYKKFKEDGFDKISVDPIGRVRKSK